MTPTPACNTLGARYYDPELGLFLQPDWFEVTEAGVGTNRYAYSGNDPVNQLDPGGNSLLKAAWSAVRTTFRGGRDTVRDAWRRDLSWSRTRDNFRDAGVDEFVGFAESAYTVIAPNASPLDRGLAAVDLVTGFNFGGQRSNSGLNDMLRRDGTVYDGPAAHRLPQDIGVNPTPPGELSLNRPVGQSPTQNAQAQRDIAELRALGATDFRGNQQQVNAAGERVGTNRPDIQCTLSCSRRLILNMIGHLRNGLYPTHKDH